jgi:hypothetical protein
MPHTRGMSKSTLAPKTRNITMLFRKATPAEIAEGIQWYRDAHEFAASLAAKNGTTVNVAAGVIAALSPLNSWAANKKLAERFMAAGGLHVGYLSLGLSKARDILAGAPIEETLNGQKTRNFYRSIITSGVEGVCIDRHAYSLAVNVRLLENNMPNIKGKRYDTVVDCYNRAAKILSQEYGIPFTAAQTQSVVWVLWRKKFWSEGAFDGR